MINKQPSKMILSEVKGGYNRIYVTNSAAQDADMLGRAFWLSIEGSSAPAILVKLDALTNYATIPNLAASTTYIIHGAFYDSMVDDDMLAVKALVELSDAVTVSTNSGPIITAINTDKVDVDIGVVLPSISFSIEGQSDTLILEYQESGTTDWVEFYSGASSSVVSVPAPKIGLFKFRCKGVIYTNNGSVSEVSNYFEFSEYIDIGFNLTNPSAPTNIRALFGRVNDSFERYDVKVLWDWNKGTGAGLKAFLVSYTSLADYNANGWVNAKTMSVGNSPSTIISNFPFNIPHKLKVTAFSFGAYPNNVADSAVLDIIINNDTDLDTSFTKETLVDLSYNGVFGYRLSGGIRVPTFAMDAVSGSLGLGTPNNEGLFPIQLNGTNGTMYVDGGIITKKINAASFVLTNFTGADNPALYSEGKTYGSGTPGLWTGYDDTTGTYKFDIGNAAKYIRWDGSDLLISGGVKIGTPLGEIELEDLVGKTTVWVYQKAVSKPAQPSGDLYPPSGWSTVPVAITNPSEVMWASQGIVNDITGKLDPGQAWGAVFQFSGSNGLSGNSTFKSVVFLRSNSKPAVPTGGSYASPVPAGWSDGAPDGTTILWTSTRIFTSDGGAPQEASWTPVAQMTDTSTQEIRWSPVLNSPGDPSNNPVNWTTTADSNTIWMAVRISYNGAWNAWQVTKTKGETGSPGTPGAPGNPGLPGSDGQRGSGFYVISTSTGTWSDATANSAVPGGVPVRDDVVTIFKQTDTKISSTKRFNGSVWVAPGLVIHGDMIATGTISGDRIVANTSITAPKIIGGEIAIGGASGTFEVNSAGAVLLKSGSVGARMEIKNDQILVYNDSGVLVVKLGRL